MKIKITPQLILIILTIFLISYLSIRNSCKNGEIGRLEKDIYRLELEKDTLSTHINNLTRTLDSTIVYMDSIYKLTKEDNDESIKNYWDSVYNSLIDNPNTGFLSDFLKDLGNR